jgi:uncharacterized membrane protein
MERAPPAGAVGASFARLFGEGDPGSIVENDLRRFKSTMEGRTAPRALD